MVMDARELTKSYIELKSEYQETKKTVEYLDQEVSKLRLIIEDLKIDVEMLSRNGR